ncbi:MAG: hypothetical protein ACREFO_16280 [Acetobacteraceae bacterium]
MNALGSGIGQSSPGLTLNSTGSIALTVSGNPGGSAISYGAAFVSSIASNGSSIAAGGAARAVTVTINAPISLIFTATSPAKDADGVPAETIGGAGGPAAGIGEDGSAGGAAGAVSVSVSNTTVTLQRPGEMPAAAVFASQVGGAGGLGGNGGLGGAGGAAGTLDLTLAGTAVSASGGDAVVAT